MDVAIISFEGPAILMPLASAALGSEAGVHGASRQSLAIHAELILTVVVDHAHGAMLSVARIAAGAAAGFPEEAEGSRLAVAAGLRLRLAQVTP